MAEYLPEIGLRIKQIRESTGEFKRGFAKTIGVDNSTLAKVEKGKNITLRLLLEIISTFNVMPNWLIKGEGEIYDSSKTTELPVFSNNGLENSTTDKNILKQPVTVKDKISNILSTIKEVQADLAIVKDDQLKIGQTQINNQHEQLDILNLEQGPLKDVLSQICDSIYASVQNALKANGIVYVSDKENSM